MLTDPGHLPKRGEVERSRIVEKDGDDLVTSKEVLRSLIDRPFLTCSIEEAVRRRLDSQTEDSRCRKSDQSNPDSHGRARVGEAETDQGPGKARPTLRVASLKSVSRSSRRGVIAQRHTPCIYGVRR